MKPFICLCLCALALWEFALCFKSDGATANTFDPVSQATVRYILTNTTSTVSNLNQDAFVIWPPTGYLTNLVGYSSTFWGGVWEGGNIIDAASVRSTNHTGVFYGNGANLTNVTSTALVTQDTNAIANSLGKGTNTTLWGTAVFGNGRSFDPALAVANGPISQVIRGENILIWQDADNRGLLWTGDGATALGSVGYHGRDANGELVLTAPCFAIVPTVAASALAGFIQLGYAGVQGDFIRVERDGTATAGAANHPSKYFGFNCSVWNGSAAYDKFFTFRSSAPGVSNNAQTFLSLALDDDGHGTGERKLLDFSTNKLTFYTGIDFTNHYVGSTLIANYDGSTWFQNTPLYVTGNMSAVNGGGNSLATFDVGTPTIKFGYGLDVQFWIGNGTAGATRYVEFGKFDSYINQNLAIGKQQSVTNSMLEVNGRIQSETGFKMAGFTGLTTNYVITAGQTLVIKGGIITGIQ